MPFRPWLLLACAALPLVPGSAEAQRSGSSDRPEVVSIDFRGNEVFPDDSLEIAIANRATECRSRIFKYLIPLCPLGFDFADDRRHLRPDELPRDVVRLELYYWQRGYREADADTVVSRDPAADEISITFEIDEGRPVLVDTILFTGDELPDPSFLDDLPLRQGDPLSGILMDATRDTLQGRLRNSGYARAEVLRSFFIPTGTYGGEVEFNVYTGPRARFGDIEVRWTSEDHSLSRESVLRFLPFQEGSIYSRDQILQAQRSLFSVALIQSARIEEDTLAEVPDSVVPLTVTLTEGDVHRVTMGVGWNTADCFNAESRWTSRNFMGGARRLSVRGRISNVFASSLNRTGCPQAGSDEFAELDWLGSVELTQPWIFSTRNSLSLRIFGERASIPDVFIREAVGARIGLTRSLGSRTPATLSWRPELSRLSAAEIFFCTSFLVCDPGDIDVLLGANWLAPLGLDVSRDRTDDLLDPSRGYRLSLGLEHASSFTGSNFSYHRVVGEGSWYHSVARRTVVATRLRAGWVGEGAFSSDDRDVDALHPQKRFYAGGASSVRGFAQNRLGPRVLTTDVGNLLGFQEVDDEVVRVCEPAEVQALTCEPTALRDGDFFPRPTGGSRLIEGNAEYRFAFAGEFQGALFLDFGQVWRDDQSMSLSDLELSPGVGVRYYSPVGPIRVDVGYRFRGAEPLNVVTSAIEPFRPGDHDPDNRICIETHDRIEPGQDDPCEGDLVAIPWVRQRTLAVLRDPFEFGTEGGLFRHLQIHFSIGQAF